MNTTVSGDVLRFLRAIDPEAARFTFQTFDDDRQRADRRLARIIHDGFTEAEFELLRLNSLGACVSVTINETDFKGRSADNIVRVRALFIDLDADGDRIGAQMNMPRAHAVIETSSDHFHFYWRVKDVALEQFADLQRALAEKFNGDPGVADLPHAMRMPGFRHNKNPDKPFTVRLVRIGEETPAAYTLSDLGLSAARRKPRQHHRERDSDDETPSPPLSPEEIKEREADVGAGLSTDPEDYISADIKRALAATDPDIERASWFGIGCALFRELGEDEGFDLWDAWSSRGAKYPGHGEMLKQWESIAKADGRYNFNIGTIFHHANAADEYWRHIELPNDTNDAPPPLDDGDDKMKNENKIENPPPSDNDAPPPPPKPKPKPEKKKLPEGVTLEDFVANLEAHDYLFIPTRTFWPGVSVNTQLKLIVHPDGNMKPSEWLDKYRPVAQSIWAPGEPMLIKDRLVADGGGWLTKLGVMAFNLYRPPTIEHGDPTQVALWLDHLKMIYPDDWHHLLYWFAHRVQRPHEKINHGLVLGGAPGIGKDTILEPVKHGVGPWNFREVSPSNLFGQFNEYLQSVILRVNEARDLGEVNRYKLYDHMKTLMAAPPDVHRVNDKYVRARAVFNVTGPIILTNYRNDAIYLPPDDRRHFVAWSEKVKSDFDDDYFTAIWKWYDTGGIANVVAFLATYNLSRFNPKAPPPKTEAFWGIVNANRPSEDAEIADALDEIAREAFLKSAKGKDFLQTDEGRKFQLAREEAKRNSQAEHPPWPEVEYEWPDAVASIQIVCKAGEGLRKWLQDPKNHRQIPYRMVACEYVPVRNQNAKDGQWKIGPKRRAIYARQHLTLNAQLEAAKKVAADPEVRKLKDPAAPF